MLSHTLARGPIAVGLVFLSGALAFPRSGKSSPELTDFVSQSGGYSLRIPSGWHVKESPRGSAYEATITREPVAKPGGPFKFGIIVARLRDYHGTFEFKSDKPAEMAKEMANRIAANIGKGAPNIVLELKTEHPDLSYFSVVAGGGKTCKQIYLAFRIAGNEWFHAQWVAPCTEDDAIGLSLKMLKSLQVNPEWGQHGG